MSDDKLSGLPSLRDDAPPLPAAFTDQVMRRAALLGRPRPRRPWLIDGPRLSLAVRPVFAAALVIALVVGAAVLRGRTTPAAAASAASAAAPPAAPVLVRFALPAPEAEVVYLVGDFNAWSAERTPLRRGRDGLWTTLVPLPHGTFQYAYVVDGHVVVDPHAESYRPDGFGGTNAILRVGTVTDPG